MTNDLATSSRRGGDVPHPPPPGVDGEDGGDDGQAPLPFRKSMEALLFQYCLYSFQYTTYDNNKDDLIFPYIYIYTHIRIYIYMYYMYLRIHSFV